MLSHTPCHRVVARSAVCSSASWTGPPPEAVKSWKQELKKLLGAAAVWRRHCDPGFHRPRLSCLSSVNPVWPSRKPSFLPLQALDGYDSDYEVIPDVLDRRQ